MSGTVELIDRYIWQLADADDYVIAWKVTYDEHPRLLELALIARFEKDHGAKPLSNISA